MKKSGILINDTLTEILTNLAYKENYITLKKCRPGLSNSYHSKLDEEKKKELLLTLLIFGRLHVRSDSNKFLNELTDGNNIFDALNLVNEGIIEIHQNRDKNIPIDIETQLFDFQNKRELIMLNIESKFNFSKSELALLNRCYDKSLSLMKTHIAREEEHFDKNLGISSLSDNIETDRFWLRNEIGLNFPDMYPLSEKIISSYNEINYYLNFSENRSLPTKTRFDNKKIRTHVDNKNTSDYHYRLYQIILEEDCTFPLPQTLDSTIKLISDRRIIDFREILTIWINSLQEGNTINERKVRMEIRKAKKALERVSTFKKVTRIISYVSLPVAVASAIAGVPAGLILVPIGPILNLKSNMIEKKNKWLLLGKY
ncbi:hypothetical protein ACJD0Z_12350 [Flavobacteriaceae bacterium M23B6Z8]